MRPSIHEDKNELFCNRCEKYLNKHSETLVLNDEVHCIYCENWLCGLYDGFGIDRRVEPQIAHIKIQGRMLTNV